MWILGFNPKGIQGSSSDNIIGLWLGANPIPKKGSIDAAQRAFLRHAAANEIASDMVSRYFDLFNGTDKLGGY